MAEGDGSWLSAVLPADPRLESGPAGTAVGDGHLDELSDAGLVERLDVSPTEVSRSFSMSMLAA